MPEEPADFVLELATQTQMLACLQWLGDFQVLACVPLAHEVAFKDVADLAGVPVAQLCRVVRMTATAGFLCEPQPGDVAHSRLSAQFVGKPSLLDAVMFISEIAVPAALHMPEATRLYRHSQLAHETARNIASRSSRSFTAACEQEPKLQRQVAAFERLAASNTDDGVTDALSLLDWRRLGKAKVVEVGAQSTATAVALAHRAPGLRFIVQMLEDAGRYPHKPSTSSVDNQADILARITIQHRARGVPQSVEDAAVYILRLPAASLSTPLSSLTAQITAELRAHFNLLRTNSNALLILVAQPQPEPGATDAKVEATARAHDLLFYQIANGQTLEMTQLLEIINNVRDGYGRLVVVNKLSSRSHLAVAFKVQVQPHSERPE